jgi:hypothetical protein
METNRQTLPIFFWNFPSKRGMAMLANLESEKNKDFHFMETNSQTLPVLSGVFR